MEGRRAWTLVEDLEDLRASKPFRSVRILPNFDRYVLGCYPRESIVVPGFQSRVFRPQAWISPTVVVDGVAKGTWSQRQKSGVISVQVEPFVKLSNAQKDLVEKEVARLGGFYEVAAEVSYNRSG